MARHLVPEQHPLCYRLFHKRFHKQFWGQFDFEMGLRTCLVVESHTFFDMNKSIIGLELRRKKITASYYLDSLLPTKSFVSNLDYLFRYDTLIILLQLISNFLVQKVFTFFKIKRNS